MLCCHKERNIVQRDLVINESTQTICDMSLNEITCSASPIW